VTTFGVFVDVGSADGLVHRSEITWDNGIEPTTLYHPGDTVRVLVTGGDRERVASPYLSSGWRRIPGDAPRASLLSGPNSRPL
jgi:hypothetical protein